MNVLAMVRELSDPTEEEIKRISGGKSVPVYGIHGTASRY